MITCISLPRPWVPKTRVANALHQAPQVLPRSAVPMVAMPFFDDQHYNAEALVGHQVAQRIGKRPVKAEEAGKRAVEREGWLGRGCGAWIGVEGGRR